MPEGGHRRTTTKTGNTTMKTIKKLAREFSAELVQDIGIENVRVAAKINAENPNAPWCASHDYCDANETMLRAFTKVMGREMAFADDPDNEADTDLVNAAWNEARRNGFYVA